ncbi:hypothetical protein BGZ58_002365 [Dissophora ornata]|nr:hypothetical protein BGZ58_002365 [Dissophora ornata]
MSSLPTRKQPLSLFFLPTDILSTFVHQTHSHAPSPPSPSPEPTTPIDLTEKTHLRSATFHASCRTCAITDFLSIDAQRSHAKSDWHHYNLKLRLLDNKGTPITLQQYNSMLLDHARDSASQDEHDKPKIQFLISKLEATFLHSNQTMNVDAASQQQQERQKALEQQIQTDRMSPMVWFTSPLYGPSVRFGVYKNALTNRGQCESVVEHLKSIQIPVPPPPPPKKTKLKRAARAMVVQLALEQQQQQPIEQDHVDLRDVAPPSLDVHRPLLDGQDNQTGTKIAALSQISAEIPGTATPPRFWTLILLGGGHFAGMVVDLAGQTSKAHSQRSRSRELNIVAHKTFYRYTVRKKQGGAQSSHGACNSAGALVRMYNERALKLEVRELLASWSHWIEQSECVFMHAPGNNRRTLFYDGSIISLADQGDRLRSFPFVTRRPTHTELKRAYSELITIKVKTSTNTHLVEEEVEGEGQEETEEDEVEEEEEADEKNVDPESSLRSQVPDGVKIAAPPLVASPDLHKLVDMVKKGRSGALSKHLFRTGINPSQLLPKSVNSEYDRRRTPTVLHLAAHHGQSKTVELLLEEHHANPTMTIASLVQQMGSEHHPVKEDLIDLVVHGKPLTAYDVAKDKETRNAFRRAMAKMPEAWDWIGLAYVPSPLTVEKHVQQKTHSISNEKKHKSRQTLGEEEVRCSSGSEMAGAQESADPSSKKLDHTKLTLEQSTVLDRERRARAAEARIAASRQAKTMREAVVQQGKSLCNTCGEDLEMLSPSEKLCHQFCSNLFK